MTRKILPILLAGCCAWAIAGQTARAAATTAASAAKPAAKPAISDAETLRYLKPDEVAQWNAAAKKISDGQSEITDGQFMLNSTAADANEAANLNIAGTHQKGAAKVKDGTAMIKDGNATQDKLRKLAIDRRDAAHQQAATTAAASFNAAIAQWPEAIPAMTASLFGQLADAKFSQIYFGGVYSFADSKYAAASELSSSVLTQLHQQDKGHLLVDANANSIRLGADNGKLFIDYPARLSDQEIGNKAALIIGELLYENYNGYAAFSLRAVDLSNMHIVANQTMMLSVEPSMAKMLGVPAFRVMARRIAPPPPPVAADASSADASASSSATPATPPPAPPPAITVKLEDPNDTLSRFKKPSYVFRFATSGHADTLANRFAALMVKSYFHDQQPNIIISDQDFLSMALPAEAGVDPASASPGDVNTAWVLPNVPDLDVPTIDLDALSARDLSNNATVKIGKITIDRMLPSQNLPSAAELRAGGYSG